MFKIGASIGRMIGEAMHLWFPQGVHYGSVVAPIIPGNSSAAHVRLAKAFGITVLNTPVTPPHSFHTIIELSRV